MDMSFKEQLNEFYKTLDEMAEQIKFIVNLILYDTQLSPAPKKGIP